MFDYLPIIAPAWIAGSLLALLSAPLGCLVLWRRMAFFSDALAHGTLLGVGLAILLNFPINIGILLVSLIVVAVLVFLDDKRLPSDALLSVVAVALLCLGLLILTQLPQQQANILGYLFGNLLEIAWADLPLLAVTVIFGIGFLKWIWQPQVAVTVIFGIGFLKWIWQPQVMLATHEPLAQIQGINPTLQRLFFMGLLAGFSTIALQAVGSLLISGMLVLPALIARLWANSPRTMVILAIILAQIAVTTGVWSSVIFDIQTGLAIVLMLAMGFFVSFLLNKLYFK